MMKSPFSSGVAPVAAMSPQATPESKRTTDAQIVVPGIGFPQVQICEIDGLPRERSRMLLRILWFHPHIMNCFMKFCEHTLASRCQNMSQRHIESQTGYLSGWLLVGRAGYTSAISLSAGSR
ncbi:hypothetical protein [Rhizobium sp. GCM10022189]|uniref:hypothetical protein n=1 Tax=Rhizobium sp. GCM10022189 TaxID=3252654 RepID=UPI003612BDDE